MRCRGVVVAPTLGRSQRHFFDRMAKFFVSLATAVKGATKNDGPTDTKSSEAQLGTRTVGRPSRELMLCPVGQQVARALARFATHEGKPSSTGRTVVTGRRRDQRSGRRAPRFFQPGAAIKTTLTSFRPLLAPTKKHPAITIP